MTDKAVLLIGFGGPSRMEDVRPFLANVLRGRPVPPARVEEVVKQYEVIGGASPYNALTAGLAEAVRARLRADGADLPVYAGMRNWPPYLVDTLKTMAAEGVREAAGVVLSTFRSEPSWDRYAQAVEEASREAGSAAPRVRCVDSWGDDPLFIEAQADRVREVLTNLPEARRAAARLVFTAHSIPVPQDRTADYSGQVARAADRVTRAVGRSGFTLAFQSRSGRPEDPWLDPDIGDALTALGKEGVKDAVVVPIGFLVDHVEVLFDLDIKARRAADAAGVRLARASTVGTHPAFVRLLADRARRALAGVPSS